jgi:hypothetical protein
VNASDESTNTDSAILATRQTSLLRGFAWGLFLGVCGFALPFVLFGVERVLRDLFSDEPHFSRGLAADSAASAVVFFFIFAAAAVAHFSPSRSTGFLRSLLAMTAFAFPALIASIVVCNLFHFDPGNSKHEPNFFKWFFLEYKYLTNFPAIFLPGAIAFTYWRITSAARTAAKATLSVVRKRRSLHTVEVLLLCISLLLFLMTFLRPVFSQRRIQPLAEGVLLLRDRPVAGAIIVFYPVQKNGQFGEPARSASQDYTEPDGQFIVHTIPKWRESNRTVGQFAVTVAFSADVEHPNISAAEMEALKRFADPETTPIHLTISAKKRDGLCIELSEWLSAEEHR